MTVITYHPSSLLSPSQLVMYRCSCIWHGHIFAGLCLSLLGTLPVVAILLLKPCFIQSMSPTIFFLKNIFTHNCSPQIFGPALSKSTTCQWPAHSPVSAPSIFLHGLFFYPEDGGSRFFQNACNFLPDYV
jgi:hypothetical protein